MLPCYFHLVLFCKWQLILAQGDSDELVQQPASVELETVSTTFSVVSDNVSEFITTLPIQSITDRMAEDMPNLADNSTVEPQVLNTTQSSSLSTTESEESQDSSAYSSSEELLTTQETNLSSSAEFSTNTSLNLSMELAEAQQLHSSTQSPPPTMTELIELCSEEDSDLVNAVRSWTDFISIPLTEFSCQGLPQGYYADQENACKVGYSLPITSLLVRKYIDADLIHSAE